MVSTPSANLLLEKPGNGDYRGIWGPIFNAIIDRMDDTIAGIVSISSTGGTKVLTDTNYVANEARCSGLYVSGVLASDAIIQVPARAKTYDVFNATTGGVFTVSIKTASGSPIVIPRGSAAQVRVFATGVVIFVSPPSDIVTGAALIGGTGLINALIDVDTATTPPATNNALVWNGTMWVPGQHAGGIYSAAATAPVSPVAGQWWKNTAATKISGVLPGGVAFWNGTSWVDVTNPVATYVAATYAASFTWLHADTPNVKIVLTGNISMVNLTGLTPDQQYSAFISNTGAVDYTVTWGTGFVDRSGTQLPVSKIPPGGYARFDFIAKSATVLGCFDAPLDDFIGTTGTVQIVSRTNTPPVSPVAGDKHIVTAGPSGAWAGFAVNDIAKYTGAAWINFAPATNSGLMAYVKAENLNYQRVGSAWVPETATTTVAGKVKVADQAIMEAAVATDAAVLPGTQKFHPSHPKAFCNFNGTGVVAIGQSFSVSSITDNGLADYTENYATAFSVTTYARIAFARTNDTSAYARVAAANYATHAKSASAFRSVTNRAYDGASVDVPEYNSISMGDQ